MVDLEAACVAAITNQSRGFGPVQAWEDLKEDGEIHNLLCVSRKQLNSQLGGGFSPLRLDIAGEQRVEEAWFAQFGASRSQLDRVFPSVARRVLWEGVAQDDLSR